jgi:hypothetical protein
VVLQREHRSSTESELEVPASKAVMASATLGNGGAGAWHQRRWGAGGSAEQGLEAVDDDSGDLHR